MDHDLSGLFSNSAASSSQASPQMYAFYNQFLLNSPGAAQDPIVNGYQVTNQRPGLSPGGPVTPCGMNFTNSQNVAMTPNSNSGTFLFAPVMQQQQVNQAIQQVPIQNQSIHLPFSSQMTCAINAQSQMMGRQMSSPQRGKSPNRSVNTPPSSQMTQLNNSHRLVNTSPSSQLIHSLNSSQTISAAISNQNPRQPNNSQIRQPLLNSRSANTIQSANVVRPPSSSQMGNTSSSTFTFNAPMSNQNFRQPLKTSQPVNNMQSCQVVRPLNSGRPPDKSTVNSASSQIVQHSNNSYLVRTPDKSTVANMALSSQTGTTGSIPSAVLLSQIAGKVSTANSYAPLLTTDTTQNSALTNPRLPASSVRSDVMQRSTVMSRSQPDLPRTTKPPTTCTLGSSKPSPTTPVSCNVTQNLPKMKQQGLIPMSTLSQSVVPVMLVGSGGHSESSSTNFSIKSMKQSTVSSISKQFILHSAQTSSEKRVELTTIKPGIPQNVSVRTLSVTHSSSNQAPQTSSSSSTGTRMNSAIIIKKYPARHPSSGVQGAFIGSTERLRPRILSTNSPRAKSPIRNNPPRLVQVSPTRTRQTLANRSLASTSGKVTTIIRMSPRQSGNVVPRKVQSDRDMLKQMYGDSSSNSAQPSSSATQDTIITRSMSIPTSTQSLLSSQLASEHDTPAMASDSVSDGTESVTEEEEMMYKEVFNLKKPPPDENPQTIAGVQNLDGNTVLFSMVSQSSVTSLTPSIGTSTATSQPPENLSASESTQPSITSGHHLSTVTTTWTTSTVMSQSTTSSSHSTTSTSQSQQGIQHQSVMFSIQPQSIASSSQEAGRCLGSYTIGLPQGSSYQGKVNQSYASFASTLPQGANSTSLNTTTQRTVLPIQPHSEYATSSTSQSAAVPSPQLKQPVCWFQLVSISKSHVIENNRDICMHCKTPISAHDGLSSIDHLIYTFSETLKGFRCGICYKRFKLASNLVKHLSSSHKITSEPSCSSNDVIISSMMFCTICHMFLPHAPQVDNRETYRGVALMDVHMRSHMPSVRIIKPSLIFNNVRATAKLFCSFCYQVFDSPSEIRDHLPQHFQLYNSTDKMKLPDFCKLNSMKGIMRSMLTEPLANRHYRVWTGQKRIERYMDEVASQTTEGSEMNSLNKSAKECTTTVTEPSVIPLDEMNYKVMSISQSFHKACQYKYCHLPVNKHKNLESIIHMFRHLFNDSPTNFTENYQFRCGICFNPFIFPQSLVKHLSCSHFLCKNQITSTDKILSDMFFCSICQAYFPHLPLRNGKNSKEGVTNLEHHFKEHSVPFRINSYSLLFNNITASCCIMCSFCFTVITNSVEFDAHVKQHNNVLAICLSKRTDCEPGARLSPFVSKYMYSTYTFRILSEKSSSDCYRVWINYTFQEILEDVTRLFKFTSPWKVMELNDRINSAWTRRITTSFPGKRLVAFDENYHWLFFKMNDSVILQIAQKEMSSPVSKSFSGTQTSPMQKSSPVSQYSRAIQRIKIRKLKSGHYAAKSLSPKKKLSLQQKSPRAPFDVKKNLRQKLISKHVTVDLCDVKILAPELKNCSSLKSASFPPNGWKCFKMVKVKLLPKITSVQRSEVRVQTAAASEITKEVRSEVRDHTNLLIPSKESNNPSLIGNVNMEKSDPSVHEGDESVNAEGVVTTHKDYSDREVTEPLENEHHSTDASKDSDNNREVSEGTFLSERLDSDNDNGDSDVPVTQVASVDDQPGSDKVLMSHEETSLSERLDTDNDRDSDVPFTQVTSFNDQPDGDIVLVPHEATSLSERLDTDNDRDSDVPFTQVTSFNDQPDSDKVLIPHEMTSLSKQQDTDNSTTVMNMVTSFIDCQESDNNVTHEITSLSDKNADEQHEETSLGDQQNSNYDVPVTHEITSPSDNGADKQYEETSLGDHQDTDNDNSVMNAVTSFSDNQESDNDVPVTHDITSLCDKDADNSDDIPVAHEITSPSYNGADKQGATCLRDDYTKTHSVVTTEDVGSHKHSTESENDAAASQLQSAGGSLDVEDNVLMQTQKMLKRKKSRQKRLDMLLEGMNNIIDKLEKPGEKDRLTDNSDSEPENMQSGVQSHMTNNCLWDSDSDTESLKSGPCSRKTYKRQRISDSEEESIQSDVCSRATKRRRKNSHSDAESIQSSVWSCVRSSVRSRSSRRQRDSGSANLNSSHSFCASDFSDDMTSDDDFVVRSSHSKKKRKADKRKRKKGYEFDGNFHLRGEHFPDDNINGSRRNLRKCVKMDYSENILDIVLNYAGGEGSQSCDNQSPLPAFEKDETNIIPSTSEKISCKSVENLTSWDKCRVVLYNIQRLNPGLSSSINVQKVIFPSPERERISSWIKSLPVLPNECEIGALRSEHDLESIADNDVCSESESNRSPVEHLNHATIPADDSTDGHEFVKESRPVSGSYIADDGSCDTNSFRKQTPLLQDEMSNFEDSVIRNVTPIPPGTEQLLEDLLNTMHTQFSSDSCSN